MEIKLKNYETIPTKVEDYTVDSWSVSEGDAVSSGDILVTILAEKESVEIDSPMDGTVKKILVQEGEMTTLDEPIAIIE